jgi:hypothetical protein
MQLFIYLFIFLFGGCYFDNGKRQDPATSAAFLPELWQSSQNPKETA